MHQGRSLTYRFATTAPLWAGALTGHTPLTPGATRRIASGVLRHFVDRGALDADGLLTLGWHGPHLPLVQEYSGPASPYWASKGFLGLLLPPDHPAWTAVEEPAPVERADVVVPLPRPGWLIQSTAADGIARLHNHGSDDQPADRVQPDNPLYARLAHSTATGPVLDGTPDNHVGVLVEGELSERGRIRPLGAGDGWAASVHAPRIRGAELPGVTVTSVVLAAGADEVHAHLVAGAAPASRCDTVAGRRRARPSKRARTACSPGSWPPPRTARGCSRRWRTSTASPRPHPPTAERHRLRNGGRGTRSRRPHERPGLAVRRHGEVVRSRHRNRSRPPAPRRTPRARRGNPDPRALPR